MKTEKEVFELKQELRDRYGPLPHQVRNLIDCLRIKLLAKELGIVSLSRREDKIWISFSPFCPLTPEKKILIEERFLDQIGVLPCDERNLVVNTRDEKDRLLIYLRQILQRYKNVLS